MQQINPWTFGIIFLIVFGYLAYNHFEAPTLFIGETKKTEGKIIDIKLGYPTGGDGYVQHVNYVYKIDDKFYTGKKTVGKSAGWQNIGNTIEIEYSKNTPENHKVAAYRNNFSSTNEKKYHFTKQDGFNLVKLINQTFRYVEYADRGKIKIQVLGEFTN